MTTMTSTSLAPSQQYLIDARLDTIERMLLGRVPRLDRIAITREVELQIFELLGDRDPQSITCDDVLDVLRQLDPPEAYLSNDVADSEHDRKHHLVHGSFALMKPREQTGREGRIGGIAGVCSFGLILLAPLFYILAEIVESEELLLIGLAGTALLGISVSICGLILSIRGRRQGILPIFGIVMAALALPVWLIGPIFVLLIL